MINPKSKNALQLYKDADDAGYIVTKGDHHVEIRSPIRGRPGVTITEDGHAYRNDIRDLTVTTNIGTIREIRKLLKIPEKT